MTPPCTSVPVSWLRLERFHLGELADGERRSIAEHLAACAACAACAARIAADDALDLAPLVLGKAPAASAPAVTLRRRHPRLLAMASGLALAAIVALAIGRAWRTPWATDAADERTRTKGDGMAFVLVRDDGLRVTEPTGAFRDGDRFKAVVTCPPSMSAGFDLVVFDAGGASFPIEASRRLACGNEVPMPGAFRLTGTGRETVCLVWTDAAGGAGRIDRGALSQPGVTASPRAMCKDLEPGGP